MLREAVRLVEHHQVARMRRGPNGGLLVCEPDAAPATHAIIIYLEYLGTTIGDLLDARLLLEPLAASLAAEQIDEAGIDRLRAVLRAEEPRDEFHAALAEQSKNPVLQLFIDILMRLTVRYAQDSRLHSASDALEAIDRRHQEHAEIVAAVTAGDSARAKTLSERPCAIGDGLATRPPASRPSGQPARIGPRGAARQARRGAGDRYPRRHRHQWPSDRGGLRDRSRAAGTLSSQPVGAAGSGSAAGIPCRREDASWTGRWAGGGRTAGAGQH